MILQHPHMDKYKTDNVFLKVLVCDMKNKKTIGLMKMYQYLSEELIVWIIYLIMKMDFWLI